MITLLKHHQIDYKRWDEAITNSHNGLVYALSWYLDIVSPGWEAVIEGDYEFVMPLPVKRKLGIPYLSQPLFTQQLGIFTASNINNEKVQEFIKKIQRKFLRCFINLNTQNPVVFSKTIMQGTNYELPLYKKYEELYSGYNENTKRNIKKAYTNNLSLKDIEITEFIKKCKLEKTSVTNNVFDILDKLLKQAQKEDVCKIVAVQNHKEEIIAGTVFIKTLNRLIYLVSFSFNEGKNKSAMFLLVDSIIKEYSQNNLILDFEGSNIPGIARFFAGFGANNVIYPIIRINF